MPSIHEPAYEALKQGEIHLYLAFPQEIRHPQLLVKYHSLMNREEQAQQKRFYSEKHRHQYLITRAVVRTVLSRYADVLPEAWQFSKNKYNRPEIHEMHNIPPLRFNLSHTNGLIACGVVLGTDIGVDVEEINRITASLKIAERFFSPQEVQDLSQLPQHKQKNRFFDYWTLKESYIKAKGMGLALPLNQFSFHLSQDNPIRISFDSRLPDHPDDWRFWLYHPTPDHKATVAIRKENNVNHFISIRKIVPLAELQEFEGNLIRKSNA